MRKSFHKNLLKIFENPIAGTISFDVTCSDEKSLTSFTSRHNQIPKINGFQGGDVVLRDASDEVRFEGVNRVIDATCNIWISFFTNMKEISWKHSNDSSTYRQCTKKTHVVLRFWLLWWPSNTPTNPWSFAFWLCDLNLNYSNWIVMRN